MFDPPSADGTSFDLGEEAESFGDPSIPADTMKAKDPTTTGTCWVHNPANTLIKSYSKFSFVNLKTMLLLLTINNIYVVFFLSSFFSSSLLLL